MKKEEKKKEEEENASERIMYIRITFLKFE